MLSVEQYVKQHLSFGVEVKHVVRYIVLISLPLEMKDDPTPLFATLVIKNGLIHLGLKLNLKFVREQKESAIKQQDNFNKRKKKDLMIARLLHD